MRTASDLPLSISSVSSLLTVSAAFIPATIARGAGTYFGVIANIDPRYIGAVIMIVAAGVAMLKIRFNAVLTGVFLAIELAAPLVLTVLGIAHARHWGSPFHGYANSVNFAEETADPSRNVARAILWSLVITVAAELIPLTATIVGAPSLATMTRSAAPLEYFINATANQSFYTVVSIGIVLAIFNAVIASCFPTAASCTARPGTARSLAR